MNGRLQYKFDCGSGPGLVSVHSAQVNDGEWHTVSLEVDGNYAKLVLDRVHAASGTAPGTLRTLNLDNRIYFGGHVRPHGSVQHGRSLPVANGLRGCLEAISLNGQELPLNTKAQRAHAVLEDAVDVTPGCALASAESCSSNPCSNGGSCSSLPNGGTGPSTVMNSCPFCQKSALPSPLLPSNPDTAAVSAPVAAALPPSPADLLATPSHSGDLIPQPAAFLLRRVSSSSNSCSL